MIKITVFKTELDYTLCSRVHTFCFKHCDDMREGPYSQGGVFTTITYGMSEESMVLLAMMIHDYKDGIILS